MDPRIRIRTTISWNTAVKEWYTTVTLAGSLGGRAGGERITGLGAATGLVFAAGGLTKTIFKDVGTAKRFLHRRDVNSIARRVK
jgi:hypothetical protein